MLYNDLYDWLLIYGIETTAGCDLGVESGLDKHIKNFVRQH
jgi:hypothetical protein